MRTIEEMFALYFLLYTIAPGLLVDLPLNHPKTRAVSLGQRSVRSNFFGVTVFYTQSVRLQVAQRS